MILPTDSELVEAAAETYVRGGEPFASDIDGAIRAFLTTRADGLNIIAIEGTHSGIGWLLDFFGLTANDHQGIEHRSLGWLHAGFYNSATVLLPQCILIAERGPFAICGHSLGAVLALMVGALLINDDKPPVKIGAFAPPRGGGWQFVKTATSVPFCAYRFGDDPITDIPLTLPDFPYEQVPLTAIGHKMFDPLDCHAIGNYVSGVKALAA